MNHSTLRHSSYVRVGLTYLAVGVGLLFAPLFNLLHVESAAVIAAAAFFASGLGAAAAFQQDQPFSRTLLKHEAVLLIPLGLLTLSLLWVPNCDYWRGLMFFGLFPGISVILAVSLAWVLWWSPIAKKKTAFCLVGMFMIVGGVVSDLGWNAQFYTYNHVFGGVLGPIYDEELAVRPGLFVLRGLTLLWAFAFWQVGVALKQDGRTTLRTKRFALTVLAIGSIYLFSARLGLTSPHWYIQEQLASHYASEHFDIYYDAEAIDEETILRIAQDHEFRYHQLAAKLATEVEGRVQSYLYPDPDTKAKLTGARYTNVAPVWLRDPQVHVLLSSYQAVFPHELAHAFSRSFGLPVLHASASVGLIEGLAVALEPPDGLPTPHEQVAVTLLKQQRAGVPTVGETLAQTLSPLGFWTGRGAVSYTTMGSFIRFMLDTYGAEKLKAVYAWGDWGKVYGTSVEQLAEEWESFLLNQKHISTVTEAWVSRRFAVPSLFEKACPHYVPKHRIALRQGRNAIAEGDSSRALQFFEGALVSQPQWEVALAEWARLALAGQKREAVIQRLDTLAITRQSAILAVRLGDAFAARSKNGDALEAYGVARQRLPLFQHDVRAQIILRELWHTEPAIIAVLSSGVDAADQAQKLLTFEDEFPAIGLARAALLLEAEEYEAAKLVLAGMMNWQPEGQSKGALDTLERYRLVLVLRTHRLLHQYAPALRAANQLADSFQEAGDFNQAAFYRDWGNKLTWLNDIAERTVRRQDIIH